MTTATNFNLCPFLVLPWQKKTFTALLIKTSLANVLFPILSFFVQIARLLSMASYVGWGHITISEQRVGNGNDVCHFLAWV